MTLENLSRNSQSTRRLFLIAGVIWITFPVSFLLILADYFAQGAGVQLFGDLFLFGFIDIAARLLIGWIHVLGILGASVVCFSVGIGLCAYAAPPDAAPLTVEDQNLD